MLLPFYFSFFKPDKYFCYWSAKSSSCVHDSPRASQQHLRTGTTCLKVTNPHSSGHYNFTEVNLFRKSISTVPFTLPLPPHLPTYSLARLNASDELLEYLLQHCHHCTALHIVAILTTQGQSKTKYRPAKATRHLC